MSVIDISDTVTARIRFISCYQGCADYGVARCDGRDWPETRVRFDANDHLIPCWDTRNSEEHGVTYEQAVSAVMRFRAEQFDHAVREIVRLGIMEYAEESAQSRAVELGLVAARSEEAALTPLA